MKRRELSELAVPALLMMFSFCFSSAMGEISVDPSVVTLQVTDPHGNPLRPRLEIFSRKYLGTRPLVNEQGTFKLRCAQPEPFAIEVTLAGYQSQVLQVGRDFECGQDGIRVVLIPGPYAPDANMWSDVTGAPYTMEAAQETAEAHMIRDRYDYYRRVAAAPRDSLEEQHLAPPPPDYIFVQVTDTNGNPIRNITVQEVLAPRARYGPMRVEAVIPDPDKKPVTMEAASGRFTVPNHSLIWAEATCRQLVSHHRLPESGDARVRLYPRTKLTIRVVDDTGRARPNYLVYASAEGGSVSIGTTTAHGELVIEGLPPGEYTFMVADNRGDNASSRAVFVRLPPDEDIVHVVRTTPLEQAKTEALDELRVQYDAQPLEERTTEPLWSGLASETRAKVRKECLVQLKHVYAIDRQNLDDVAFLANVAMAADLRKALPLLKSLWSQPQPGVRLTSVQSQRIPMAIAALAGDDSISFLKGAATDARLTHDQRCLSIIALCSLGTPQSLAAWKRLKEQTRNALGLPPEQAQYTHEQRMAEALNMVHNFIPERDNEPWTGLSGLVSEDYREGEMHANLLGGSTEFFFRRFGDEWVVVGVGFTTVV